MTIIHFLGPRLKRTRCSGNAVVEFAVTLPIILSVLLGIINSGQIFWVRQVLESASREGARVFTAKILTAQVISNAQATAEKFLLQKDANGKTVYFGATTTPSCIAGNGGQITVTLNPNSASSTQTQRTVTVQVPMTKVLLVGNYLNLVSGNLNIVGSTTFEADQ